MKTIYDIWVFSFYKNRMQFVMLKRNSMIMMSHLNYIFLLSASYSEMLFYPWIKLIGKGSVFWLWRKQNCAIRFGAAARNQDLSRRCIFEKELSSLVKLELKVSNIENTVSVMCSYRNREMWVITNQIYMKLQPVFWLLISLFFQRKYHLMATGLRISFGYPLCLDRNKSWLPNYKIR